MKGILLAALLVPCASARAGAADNPFEYYQQEARTVTATRRVQPVDEVPASVDVITSREIEASGAQTFCDLLRFRPGLDVVDGRNTGGVNRCVVSIRGMARDSVRELMVLIDGHSVYSPMSGTILWEQLPVQLQDVQRIEIVRGPNAALYGSGAGLGVINIITKAPRSRAQASGAATGGSLGSVLTEEAFDDARSDFSYRLSHTYRQTGGYPTVTGLPSNDFLHSQKASAAATWRPDALTKLDIYAGGSWDTMGLPTGFNSAANAENHQARFRSHFESARLSHRIDDDAEIEVNLTRNEQVAVIGQDPINPSYGLPASDMVAVNEMARYYQYDLEAQNSFGAFADRLHTTWGGEFIYSVADSADLFGTGTPLQVNRTIRGFVHETARLSDKTSLVGGVSLEQPWFTGSRHADYQAALLHDVEPGQTLRASYSLAHTNPGLVDAKGDYFATAGAVHIIPTDSLKSYELANYETGYRGSWLNDRFVVGASLYYMKIRDHVNIETIAQDLPTILQNDNSNYLIARGAEVEAAAHVGAGDSLYVNYSHEIVTDRDSHTVYIKTTPAHIVNLGFIAQVWRRLSASANAGWKDGYLGDSVSGTNQVSVNPFWRLDARLAYAVSSSFDLFVGGRNLMQARHVEFVDGLTVPRTYYGGVKVRFP